MSNKVEKLVSDIASAGVPPYYRYTRHADIRVLAASNSIITGSDFTGSEYADVAENMLKAVASGYHMCLNDIEDYDGIMGTFINFDEKNGNVDLISLEGKITKIGIKLKNLTVLPKVAFYQSEELFMDVPTPVSIVMEGVYVTPRNTKVEKMTVTRGAHCVKDFGTNLSYVFNIREVPNFEGFQKTIKPILENQEVNDMKDTALEALTFHENKIFVRGKKKCLAYQKENKTFFIHRNKTSTMVEWGLTNVHRVTVYKDKVVFSYWKSFRSGLCEVSRTLDKSSETIALFERAVLARKLTQT